MRLILALPLLLLGACSVQRDNANGQTTIDLNSQPVEDAASKVGNAVEGAASDLGNAASETGNAIESDVGNLHVDVDVDHDRSRNSH